MQIVSRAPTRIDLSGGTLDIWPIYLLMNGAITINAAVDLYAGAKLTPLAGNRIELTSLDQNLNVVADGWQTLDLNGSLSLLARLVHHFAPQTGVRLETDCKAPAGSGLGGSSSLAIAVAGALNELTKAGYTKEQLIAVCRDVEAQVIRMPTGQQDYFAAMHGGFNAWHFSVERVNQSAYAWKSADLQNRVILFFSGQPRFSGINNWQVFKSAIDRDPAVFGTLQEIGDITKEVNENLKKGNWEHACDGIDREWAVRKRLAPGITTPEIDELIGLGKKEGAIAGRVCGAGGGGCVVLFCSPDTYQRVYDATSRSKFPLLDAQFVDEGMNLEITGV